MELVARTVTSKTKKACHNTCASLFVTVQDKSAATVRANIKDFFLYQKFDAVRFSFAELKAETKIVTV